MQKFLKLFVFCNFRQPLLCNDYRSTKIHYQNNLYGISSLLFCRWNQFKVIPLAYTLRTRSLPKFSVMSDTG